MTGQAFLAARLVAIAEEAGKEPSEINAVLKEVAEHSAIEEFWVTESAGQLT
jgi:hypothetical protein